MNTHPQPPVSRHESVAEPSDLPSGIARPRPPPPPGLLLSLVAVDHRDGDVGVWFTRQFTVGTREERAEGTDVPPDLSSTLTRSAYALTARSIRELLPVHAVHAVRRYII